MPRAAAGLLIPIALLGWRGYSALSQRADITVPTTLSGQPQAQGPEIDAALAAMKAELKNQNPGKTVEVAAYGADGAPKVVLGLVRGRLDVNKEFEDLGVAVSRQSFVPVTCVAVAADVASACMWSGSVSGGLFGYGMPIAEVAEIAKEARDATQ